MSSRDPKFSLDEKWAKLPRLSFTREAPASSGVEVEQTDTAYGVRSAEILSAEFDNRVQRIRKSRPPSP
jgi:hypothetical protein